jgi:DNA polymerase III subunit gamma/tau
MVFYRKYRPQKISELDNEVVRENLTSIFSKKNSFHAFLFTGPKGLGKTSAARIVAKVINCVGRKDKSDVEPCNKCEQCVSITNGSNLDILEIDAASNRGIDEIRDLREKIKLAPFKASKKIYIIDEVHMLTTEAFNALLKTLEEPPGHAVFILCTTETSKIPATIASRCFRINFTKATSEEFVRSLSRIVKAEDIKIEKDALIEIGSLSDGSFRDGVKILEELVNFAGKKTITKDLVNEKYNILGIGDNVIKMLEILSKKDLRAGITLCQNLEKQGMDFKFFTEKLIERLHFMLLVEAGVEKGETLFSLPEIRKLFELLSDAYAQTKSAVLPQTPLEIVVMEWGEENNNEIVSQQPHLSDDAHQASQKTQTEPRSLNERLSSNQKDIVDDSSKSSFNSSAIGLPPSDFFARLIGEIKEHNNLFAGVLRGCKAGDIENDKLIITASSKFHKEKIEETKNMQLLLDAARKISGKEVKIEVILK